MLLREAMTDPLLSRYGCVLLDEGMLLRVVFPCHPPSHSAGADVASFLLVVVVQRTSVRSQPMY